MFKGILAFQNWSTVVNSFKMVSQYQKVIYNFTFYFFPINAKPQYMYIMDGNSGVKIPFFFISKSETEKSKIVYREQINVHMKRIYL